MEDEVGITISFGEDKNFIAVSEMLGGFLKLLKNGTGMLWIRRIITDILIRFPGHFVYE